MCRSCITVLLFLSSWYGTSHLIQLTHPRHPLRPFTVQFISWFEKHGGISKVGLADFAGMGRGVQATSDVEVDSEVMVIPNKLILSQNNLLASSDPLHAQIAKVAASGEQAVIGALLLEKTRGEQSFFYEYLQVLPEHVPNLSYFSAKSLESLQSPALASEMLFEQRQSRQDFSALTKAVRKIWPGGRKALPTWEDYQWAKSILDSRGLRFSGVVHLAPFADMFNYGPHSDKRQAQEGNFFLTHHKLDAEAGVLRILADRAASKGEQLLEDYGDNRDKIYLQYHGFVSETNPFRCVELQLPNMRDEEVLPRATRSLLSDLRFQKPPQSCVERDGNLDKSTLVYLFAISMSPAEVQRCAQVVQSSKGDAQPWATVAQGCGFTTLFKELDTAVHSSPEDLIAVPATGSDTEGKPFHALVQQMRSRIAATFQVYPSTLEDDELVLADWEGGAVGVDGHGNIDKEEMNSLNALRYRVFAKRHLLHLSKVYGSTTALTEDAEAVEAVAVAEPAPVEKAGPEAVEVEAGGGAGAASGTAETPSAAAAVPAVAAADPSAELREGEMPINTTINEASMTLEEQLERFNKWFNAAAPVVNKLAASFIPGWRIGTIATGDIADKQHYLGVPKSVVMDSAASRKHPVLKDLYRRLTEVFGLEASDDFHELLFLLIYEQHVSGKDSFYWPYLSLLPTPLDQVIVPTRWTHEEMMERLAPSHILNNLVEYQSQQVKTFQSLTGILPVKSFFTELDAKLREEAGLPAKATEKSLLDTFESEVLNWETYVWAQAILDSRSIWWEGKRHLVPMLDFINCIEGPDPARVHSTTMDDTNTNAMTAASWAFTKGEQVFENYGQANYIYFMYHGFALPVGENTHDCFIHTVKLTDEETKQIDFTDQLAQNVAKQVGFNRSPSAHICMSVEGDVGAKNRRTGLPQDIWLAMSLKQNNYKSLREQKLLGLPNLSAMQLLHTQLEARQVAYSAHFAKGDPHKSSTFFLRTEEHHLQGVLRYLRKEIAALGGTASSSTEEL